MKLIRKIMRNIWFVKKVKRQKNKVLKAVGVATLTAYFLKIFYEFIS